jgi:hypothetical protein
MAQQTQKKTYTEKEVRTFLEKQKELCKKAIDAESISQFTARKKIDETKLAIDEK